MNPTAGVPCCQYGFERRAWTRTFLLIAQGHDSSMPIDTRHSINYGFRRVLEHSFADHTANMRRQRRRNDHVMHLRLCLLRLTMTSYNNIVNDAINRRVYERSICSLMFVILLEPNGHVE